MSHQTSIQKYILIRYFDEHNALKISLSDISVCKNNIAHDTYVDDSEKRLIISNFK